MLLSFGNPKIKCHMVSQVVISPLWSQQFFASCVWLSVAFSSTLLCHICINNWHWCCFGILLHKCIKSSVSSAMFPFLNITEVSFGNKKDVFCVISCNIVALAVFCQLCLLHFHRPCCARFASIIDTDAALVLAFFCINVSTALFLALCFHLGIKKCHIVSQVVISPFVEPAFFCQLCPLFFIDAAVPHLHQQLTLMLH